LRLVGPVTATISDPPRSAIKGGPGGSEGIAPASARLRSGETSFRGLSTASIPPEAGARNDLEPEAPGRCRLSPRAQAIEQAGLSAAPLMPAGRGAKLRLGEGRREARPGRPLRSRGRRATAADALAIRQRLGRNLPDRAARANASHAPAERVCRYRAPCAELAFNHQGTTVPALLPTGKAERRAEHGTPATRRKRSAFRSVLRFRARPARRCTKAVVLSTDLIFRELCRRGARLAHDRDSQRANHSGALP
jgi:hypothetical protein